MERLILRSGLRLSPAGYQVLMGLTSSGNVYYPITLLQVGSVYYIVNITFLLFVIVSGLRDCHTSLPLLSYPFQTCFFWKVTAYSCPSPQSPFTSPTMEEKKRTFNVWLPLILRFHKFLCLITILLSLILSWRPLHSLLYSCKKTILSQVHIKNLLLLRTWCFKMITFSDSNYKLNLGFKWRSITLLVPWIYMCLSF